MGLDVFSPTESPKSMLTPFSGANHSTRTSGGALCTGADGPRPGAGRSAAWREARVSCLTAERSVPCGRTVHACAGAAEDRQRCLDLTPGRDPVGEERSYVMSRLGQTDLDSSNRRRVEEKRRIWGLRG
jgi:hypothetical protein